MKVLKTKLINLFSAETEHCLYWLSIILIIFLLVVYGGTYLVAEHFGLDFLKECGMRKIFGIPCPGCGGTRAVICLFTGRFLSAVYYNAFAVYSVILYIIFFLTQTLQRITKGKITGMRFRDIYWQLAIVILIIQYIAKFVLPGYLI